MDKDKNVEKLIEEKLAEKDTVKVKHLITITELGNGQVIVNGPLKQIVYCYGMLEIAKDIIRNHKPKEQPLITVPQDGGMPA